MPLYSPVLHPGNKRALALEAVGALSGTIGAVVLLVSVVLFPGHFAAIMVGLGLLVVCYRCMLAYREIRVTLQGPTSGEEG